MKPLVQMAHDVGKDSFTPIDHYPRKLLAEGDSWYTIGTVEIIAASNLLHKLEMQKSTAIINCAYPGETLKRMVNWKRDKHFSRLLSTHGWQQPWHGILLSAGGNDLIDAARVPAKSKSGVPIPPDQRLFLTGDEIKANGGGIEPDRFLSDEGWRTFTRYLLANFDDLIQLRDQGLNKGKPILLHTYVSPTVRPSGTPGNSKGWLYPALKNYGIVGADAQGVSELIFGKLRQLLLNLDCRGPGGLAEVYVFDSAKVPGIEPAKSEDTGSSGDWVNEIHLTPKGYEKVGGKMGPWMDSILK